jgi:MFS transporter, DHA1 family, multidrug resistance protein
MKVTSRPYRFALLLAVYGSLGSFSFDMYLPSFPQMMAFFQTDASMIQASLTSCLLGLGVGQVVMGALSDVYGRRKPLFTAMIFFVISSIGCAFAPNIGAFIVLRFIQGFAISAGTITSAIARDTYNGVELTKFYTLIAMMGSVAPLIAPIAGSMVLSFASWRGVFLFLGLLGMVLVGTTLWRLKETLPPEKRIPSNFLELWRNFKALLQNRAFMGFAFVQGFMVAGVFAYISGTPFIYQKMYGVTPHMFSLLFALNGISLLLGSQLVKLLAGRVTGHRILQTGLAIAVISSLAVLIVVLTQGPLIALVIPLFFFIASTGIIGSAIFPLAMESQAHIAGSASAMLGVIPFLFGSITSPLVGIAGEYSAVPLAVIIVITCSLAAMAYVGLVRLRMTAKRGIEAQHLGE